MGVAAGADALVVVVEFRVVAVEFRVVAAGRDPPLTRGPACPAGEVVIEGVGGDLLLAGQPACLPIAQPPIDPPRVPAPAAPVAASAPPPDQGLVQIMGPARTQVTAPGRALALDHPHALGAIGLSSVGLAPTRACQTLARATVVGETQEPLVPARCQERRDQERGGPNLGTAQAAAAVLTWAIGPVAVVPVVINRGGSVRALAIPFPEPVADPEQGPVAPAEVGPPQAGLVTSSAWIDRCGPAVGQPRFPAKSATVPAGQALGEIVPALVAVIVPTGQAAVEIVPASVAVIVPTGQAAVEIVPASVAVTVPTGQAAVETVPTDQVLVETALIDPAMEIVPTGSVAEATVPIGRIAHFVRLTPTAPATGGGTTAASTTVRVGLTVPVRETSTIGGPVPVAPATG